MEKFITNLQRERSEVAFHIFTYGKQSLALNLSERFTITDDALEQMPWPTIITSPNDPNATYPNNRKTNKTKLIGHFVKTLYICMYSNTCVTSNITDLERSSSKTKSVIWWHIFLSSPYHGNQANTPTCWHLP